MEFPDWVLHAPDEDKASARLRYLINKAAVECAGSGSLANFASAAGVDRTLLYRYITAGAFTESAAQRIERVAGHVVTAVMLVDPMSIAVD